MLERIPKEKVKDYISRMPTDRTMREGIIDLLFDPTKTTVDQSKGVALNELLGTCASLITEETEYSLGLMIRDFVHSDKLAHEARLQEERQNRIERENAAQQRLIDQQRPQDDRTRLNQEKRFRNTQLRVSQASRDEELRAYLSNPKLTERERQLASDELIRRNSELHAQVIKGERTRRKKTPRQPSVNTTQQVNLLSDTIKKYGGGISLFALSLVIILMIAPGGKSTGSDPDTNNKEKIENNEGGDSKIDYEKFKEKLVNVNSEGSNVAGNLILEFVKGRSGSKSIGKLILENGSQVISIKYSIGGKKKKILLTFIEGNYDLGSIGYTFKNGSRIVDTSPKVDGVENPPNLEVILTPGFNKLFLDAYQEVRGS